MSNPLRVGIDGSGKTAAYEMLSKKMRDRYEMAVITNDIYTKEDMEILLRAGALPAERLMGVETSGCPHTAIREDASINLEAIACMNKDFPGLDLILIESGGDNLASTFSPELSNLTIYVIDVAVGKKIPRKGGPALHDRLCSLLTRRSLAPYVGVDLGIMARDAKRVRGERPFVFTNLRTDEGIQEVIDFIVILCYEGFGNGERPLRLTCVFHLSEENLRIITILHLTVNGV